MSDGGAHSVAGPSALHQIKQCPGSIVMQLPFPEVPDSEASRAAAEGTAAHWAMAELMAGRSVKVDDRAPNGVFLTDEMIEAAELIVDDVLRTIQPFGLTLADCATEVPVAIRRIHELCWGTPDIRVWLPGKVLVVWDLKFGYRHVSAFENVQTLAYSVGAIDTAGHHDLDVKVINRIVQPRSYSPEGPVREWQYRAADQRALVNIVSTAVHEALGPSPRTHVGPACRDCRAAHACTTLQRAAETAMDVAGTAMPHVLEPAALGVELRNIERLFGLLKARMEALQEQGVALARGGARIPNFKMQPSSGKTVWKKPAAEVIQLGRMLEIDLAKPPAAITPSQAAARGFPDSLMAGFIEKQTGANKLVPDDGAELRRVFSRPSTP